MTEIPTPPPESRLRGTLINQQPPVEQATLPYVPDAENVHMDSAAPFAQPESRLRSTFDRNVGHVGLDGAEVEVPVGEVGVGAAIVNRDSGIAFKIAGITETKHGSRANLVGPSGEKITLGLDDLKSKLSTEGSPWHW